MSVIESRHIAPSHRWPKLVAFFLLILTANTTTGQIVPSDWRLAQDGSNVLELRNYDSVAPTSNYDQPYGTINKSWGWRIWVVNAFHNSVWFGKIAGVIDTDESYTFDFGDFGPAYGIYGESEGDHLKLAANLLGTDTFLWGEIGNGILHDQGFQGIGRAIGPNDFFITTTPIVPEPGACQLVVLGMAALGIRRRGSSVQGKRPCR